MLPAIMISSISSALSGIFKDYPLFAIIVCGLTALNSFILTLVLLENVIVRKFSIFVYFS
jgi:hypothetical protein